MEQYKELVERLQSQGHIDERGMIMVKLSTPPPQKPYKQMDSEMLESSLMENETPKATVKYHGAYETPKDKWKRFD